MGRRVADLCLYEYRECHCAAHLIKGDDRAKTVSLGRDTFADTHRYIFDNTH
jgi:hypothetical protein